MPIIRAMAIFQGGTDLPEDRFVNTWHFEAATFTTAQTDDIEARLVEFYATPPTGQNAIGTFMSQFVERPFEVRSYWLPDPEPRVPVIGGGTLPTAGTTTNDMPEEVAVVMSLVAEPPVTRSRRGRIYLGPLNGNAKTDAGATEPTRVNPSFTAAIVGAATRLMDGNATGPTWVIWSPTTATAAPVAGGFVDNAFDTQRRRGPDPTARSTFPLP